MARFSGEAKLCGGLGLELWSQKGLRLKPISVRADSSRVNVSLNCYVSENGFHCH